MKMKVKNAFNANILVKLVKIKNNVNHVFWKILFQQMDNVYANLDIIMMIFKKTALVKFINIYIYIIY